MQISKTLRISTGILLGVFVFLFFFRPLEIEDDWWHLATGRWIVTNGRVPHVDVFHVGGGNTPWIFTQWLGSTIYYLVYLFGGYVGLQAYRAFLFAVIIAVFFVYAYRKIPYPFLIVLSFIMAYWIETRCLLRPDVYNFIFIQLFTSKKF